MLTRPSTRRMVAFSCLIGFALVAALVVAPLVEWSAQSPGPRLSASDQQAEKTLEKAKSQAILVPSPVLPEDVDDPDPDFNNVHNPAKIPEAQRLFDLFAWRMFIGLNWPANDDGSADAGLTLAADAGMEYARPRVWELYAEVNSLFRRFGEAPMPWPKGRNPNAAKGLAATRPTLWMTTMTRNRNARHRSSLADENLQAFTGPLVDQKGNWVRYQVLVNRTEYEYVRLNHLYSLEGQAKFCRSEMIDFPRNGGHLSQEKVKYGSTELKLAWKQLGSYDAKKHGSFDRKKYDLSTSEGWKRLGEDYNWFDAKERFLWRWVHVIHSDAPQVDGVPQPDPVPVPMGLVGMHIAVRTRSSPQWIWTTFEHVDNVRVNDLEYTGEGAKKRRLSPLFNNPNLPTKPINMLPPKNSRPDASGAFTDWDEAKTTLPVQVTRVIPLTLATEDLNRQVRELLAAQKSVLQYYELIGTQWPVEPKLPVFPSGNGSSPESVVFRTPGRVVPVYLVNTTMETYFQAGMQPAGPLAQDDRLPPGQISDPTMIFGTESCAGCHYSAGACLGFKTDINGLPVYKDGYKVPIFGMYANGGRTGNANFSWLLQMKAQSEERPLLVSTKGASLSDTGSDPEQNSPLVKPLKK